MILRDYVGGAAKWKIDPSYSPIAWNYPFKELNKNVDADLNFIQRAVFLKYLSTGLILTRSLCLGLSSDLNYLNCPCWIPDLFNEKVFFTNNEITLSK